MRLAAAVQYDGTAYSGWQRQPFFAQTVQHFVEEALSKVANEPIETFCAGRTDAGVHALAQIIHWDTHAHRSAYAWLAGGNRYLPPDIRLQWLVPVREDFHARYSAVARNYRYLVRNGAQPAALWHTRSAWQAKRLNSAAMRRAAAHLIGEHDFSAFRAAECQSKTPMRCLSRVDIAEEGDWLWFDVRGNAFLHHMVRNIVGSLFLVGQGKRPPSWISEVLAHKDRRLAGPTAPPQGLYLVSADYPAHFALPPNPNPRGGLW